MIAHPEAYQRLAGSDTYQLGFTVALGLIGAAILYYFFAPSSSSATKTALNPDEYVHFELAKKEQVSHNTIRLRFALQSPEHVLGLPIGQHIFCQGKDAERKDFSRPYTPTTLDDDIGHFELVIKVYPQGKMSQFLDKTPVGSTVAFKGPKGRFKYTPNMVRAFGMIAGGTGITPMFQVMKAILKNPEEKTQLSLIYANVTRDDILLKEELDAYAAQYPGRVKVYYVLNEPPKGWDGGVGFVTAKMIKDHLPAPADDIQILMCGPLPMNKAMNAHLDTLEYGKDMRFQF